MADSQRPARGRGTSFEVYGGALGRTRSEAFSVCMADGSYRVLNLHVSVDAAHDPALATLARSGALHTLEDGSSLAQPFVYHDARHPMLVLVVPEALRHRALALRAEFLSRIAADVSADAPPYAVAAEIVIGAEGLRTRLAIARDDDQAAVDVDDGELDELDAIEDEPTDAHRSDISELVSEVSELAFDQVTRTRSPPHLAELADALITDDALADELLADELLADDALADDALEDEVGPDALDAAEYARPSDVQALDPGRSMPPPAYPPEAVQAWLTDEADRVWLYVRNRPSNARAHADVDVLVQRDPSTRLPLFVLTAVFDVGGSPEVRRGLVDPTDPDDRRVLQRLADAFEVELVDVSRDGAQQHWGTLYAPREPNVSALLTWVDRVHPFAATPSAEERTRVLAAPPPWRDLAHPFQRHARSTTPASATEAAVALDELALWLGPERLDHVRMDLSVSDELIDAECRDVLAHALDFGLALDPLLSARALALGVAPHVRGLLERRIAGLCRTSDEADYGGLSEDVLRTLWAEVLEHAPLVGLTLSPEAEQHALRHAGERALVHAQALACPHDDSLAPLRARFGEGARDLPLLRGLITRGGLRDVLSAVQAAAELGDSALGQMFACLSTRTDVAGIDAAQALLASGTSSLLKIGAALVLAARRSVAAIPELVRHVAVADDDEACAIAAALGRYGAGSFRAVLRALSEAQVQPAREAWVLAGLIQHGARAQVRARARSHIVAEAQLAERALELANSLKEMGNPLVGLEQQGALTVFFQVFDHARHAVAEGDHGGVDSAALLP